MHPQKTTKILFLLKLNYEYGETTCQSRAGLRYSVKFIVDAINLFTGVIANFDYCVDGNTIDSKIVQYRPDVCVLEAVWVAPAKLQELHNLHPHVRFITRVHSKIPFLSMEGNVIDWLRQYEKISQISFNNLQTSIDMGKIGFKNIYLPNIYPEVDFIDSEPDCRKYLYKIGCFGAIRPFKNQLIQAVAAIMFAENQSSSVHFYINAGRVEQKGETVLKSLRSLFEGTRHKLIEVDWLDHPEFLKLVGKMDVCMQVSFTETFNIVTADCIQQHVPVVVSDQIEWLTCRKADPNSALDIAECISEVIGNEQVVENNIRDLSIYNRLATNQWFNWIRSI